MVFMRILVLLHTPLLSVLTMASWEEEDLLVSVKNSNFPTNRSGEVMHWKTFYQGEKVKLPTMQALK